MKSPDHELTPKSCLDHILDLISQGQFVSSFRENPQCLIGCAMIFIGGVLHSKGQTVDPKPITFGSKSEESEFRQKCCQLFEYLNGNGSGFTTSSPHAFESIADVLIQRVIQLLIEALLDYLNKGPAAGSAAPAE